MKKLLAFLLSVTMMAVFFSFPVAAEETDRGSTLIVGSTTQMSGSFFTSMWGNNTADNDVRGLLHDYQTIAWTSGGSYTVNGTVVSDVSVVYTAQQNRRYTFTLFDDLVYSDGTPVTARDYVFSILLQSAPQTAAIGGINTAYSHLTGYEDFAKGNSNVFSGVRLTGDLSFSLSISSEYLPYFYELAFANVTPYPMSVIAPGCDIVDDGNGAYITGGFTAELLRTTILDPGTGYLSHPAVTSGAYKLTGYDSSTRVAEFEINDNYKGNYEGQKPGIRKLVFREVKNNSMLEELSGGEIDLINKVSSGEVIGRASEMSVQGQAKLVSYLRSGLSFIAFANEQGYTQSVKLRQAVAHSIDEEALTNEFLLGNGVPVYGYYGYGQWMIAQVQDRLTELNIYLPDNSAAAGLLIEDGWIYDQNGESFDPGTDTQRYRKNDDGTLVPLILKLAITKDNEAANIAVKMLRESFSANGVALEVTEMETYELFSHYYRQADRTYDMFFLASNFTYIFDPYYTFNVGEEYQGAMNTSGLKDEKLMALTKDMRETEANDLQGYLDKWMAFQLYFAEVLPLVPLYSNVYYDISRMDLNNYFANNYWSWSAAVLYATLGEVPEATPAP